MRRQDKYPDTSAFHYHNENPKGRITGDCAFRAIATALEKPWSQVVMEMAETSVRTGYAINDSKGIEKYLIEQGWTKHSQPRKWDNTKYTGKEFCEEIQRSSGSYSYLLDQRIIAHLGGNHDVAIVGGKVWDIWDSTDGCIGNYWTKD